MSVVSVLPAVPITQERPPPKALDQYIPNPGQPRANVTVDKEHPEGTYRGPEDMSVLQQHVAFWDADADGVIWPGDTYRGFRRLGFNPLLSAVAVPVIHGTFSYPTSDSWLPDPFFRLFMKNMHRTKHGSDSQSYDTEGRFVPQKFEEIFSKYDKGSKGGLTLKEINAMIRQDGYSSMCGKETGNRSIFDPTGWIAEWLEWNTTYLLIAKDTPHGRLLLKDDARRALDGTLFYAVAKDLERGKLQRRGAVQGAGFAQRKEE